MDPNENKKEKKESTDDNIQSSEDGIDYKKFMTKIDLREKTKVLTN